MPLRRALLLASWCVALAGAAWWSQRHFSLSADLRDFLPEPRTETQHLLLQNIGQGPASRLLLVALDGDDPLTLARVSNTLAVALSRAPELEFVANTSRGTDLAVSRLLAYRYLLTDSFDSAPLNAARLTAALQERLADLSSPAGAFIEEWLPRDPTLEMAHLAERWQPRQEPRHVADVWFTGDGKRALLLVETRAAAFDPDGQAAALARIDAEFAKARAGTRAQLTLSGAGYFGARIKQAMQREAALFGGAATLGLVTLMWVAYRRWQFTLLGALPLVSGGLAGLIAVGSWFESVHGITLAFGFTLIGVAQDYPVHVFSHLRRGLSPLQTAREVWPPLLTGVASTCIAYLAFLVSGVTGLAQLACFTVTGLAVAASTTRFLLPRIVGDPERDAAQSPLLARIDARVARLPRMSWLYVAVPIACAGVMAWRSETSFWQNDLTRLTPVAPDLLRADADLRRELGTPDQRHLLVVSGGNAEQVLAKLEALDERLEALRRAGDIAGFDHAARLIPSAAMQRQRQRSLPDPSSLRTMLAQANESAGFDDGLFEPFVADIEAARALPLLTRANLEDTPLALRVDSLLVRSGERWHGLVTFREVRDAAPLAALAAQAGHTWLDLKGASEALVATQRGHILRCLLLAAGALVVVLALALRSPRRVLRVLAPVFLSTLLVLALLRALGLELSIFHLISLVLAAGLGLDYALFFEHAASDPDIQKRTLHALIVCALSTLLVFALLAASSAPVLRAIGVTVALGVLCNFALGLVLARERRAA